MILLLFRKLDEIFIKIYVSIGLKITKVLFFIKNERKGIFEFRLIDEFFKLEEIQESLYYLSFKLKSLQFKNTSLTSHPYSGKAILEIENTTNSIDSSVIKFPSNIYLASENKYLFTINSEDFKIKIVMKLESGKGPNFSPIKKVNYILENNKNFSYDLIFDMLTDLSATPFYNFKNVLKNMKNS